MNHNVMYRLHVIMFKQVLEVSKQLYNISLIFMSL